MGEPECESRFNTDPNEEDGLLNFELVAMPQNLGVLCAWLAPALDVDLYVEDESGLRRVVAASDWITIDGTELLERISGQRLRLQSEYVSLVSSLRLLHDSQGEILGRAAILYRDRGYIRAIFKTTLGVITVGGLRAGDIGSAGILIGSPRRASRDEAIPLAGSSLIGEWASEQAVLIAENIPDPALQFVCASKIVLHGGNPGKLPITKKKDKFINREALIGWQDAPGEIALFSLDRLSPGVSFESIVLHPHVLGYKETEDLGGYIEKPQGFIRNWLKEALAQAWGCSPSEMETHEQWFDNYEVGIDSGHPATAYHITILKRP